MWWGTEGFSAKECQAAVCQLADPVSSLPPCCRPYLVTIRHRGGHRTLWTLIRTLSQADRQAAHRASAPVTRTDKVRNQNSFKGQTAGANYGAFTDLSVIVLTATCPQVLPFHLGWEFARMLFLKQLFIKMQRVSIQIINRGKRFAGSHI